MIPPPPPPLRARVARLLRESDQPITQITHDLGFSSSQYFATVIKRCTRQTPRALRAGAAGG